MDSELKLRLLKDVCGDFIEDFLIDNNLINSTEHEFTIDLKKYDILLIPYLVKWLNIGDHAVELLLLNFGSINNYIKQIINFLYLSQFHIVSNHTNQIAYIILSESYDSIYEKINNFYLNNKQEEI